MRTTRGRFLSEMGTKVRRYEEARTHPGEGRLRRESPGELIGGPTPAGHRHVAETRNPDRPGGRSDGSKARLHSAVEVGSHRLAGEHDPLARRGGQETARISNPDAAATRSRVTRIPAATRRHERMDLRHRAGDWSPDGPASVRQIAHARRESGGDEEVGRRSMASISPSVGNGAKASPNHRRRSRRGLEGHRNPAHLLLAGEYTNDPRRHGRGAQGARGTHFTSGKQVVKQAPKQGTPVLPASVTHCKLIGTAGFEPATP